jgi:hypothetical protein
MKVKDMMIEQQIRAAQKQRGLLADSAK